jgi:hypothetical protein
VSAALSETAALALRTLHFVKVIHQTSQQWLLDDRKWEEDKSPLETLPNTSSEFSAESLSNCRSAALSIVLVIDAAMSIPSLSLPRLIDRVPLISL